MGESLSGKVMGRLRAGGLLWPAAAALVAGLYLGRVWSECGTQARSWLQIAGMAAAGLAVATLGVVLLRRARRPVWPLVLLGVYVLWPWADARMALAVAIVSLVTLLLARQWTIRVPGDLLDFLVGGVALLLYVGTLAPSVQPADAGEFQLVAAVLGIAHPPGYPLYTMLGKLFTLVPLGDVAWRVNLFAAVCAAATLVVVSRSVRQATGSGAAGALAALALGLVPTFWAQGTFANIRSLTALLTALSIHWLLRYGEARSGRYLVAFAVTFGLGITHHSSLALLALPFIAYLIAVDPRLVLEPRRWLAPAAGLGASLLVLLYLPLRSAMHPAFDPAPIRTFDAFLGHVLALGFRGDFLYFLWQPTLGLRLNVLADILRIELGWALLAASLALGLFAARRRRPWVLLWAGVALVNGFAAITYRAPQTVEYLLPTYVALAVGLGLGLGTILRAWPGQAVPAVLAGLVAWWGLANGLAAYPSYRALHADDSLRRQMVDLLRAAPPQAVILSNWHLNTPLLYLQQVEGLRPDVTVTYVYPEGAMPNGQVWARRIQETIGQRPVLVTNRFAEYASLPYRLSPVGPVWAVQPAGAQTVPAGLAGQPRVLGEKIEFLGARIGQAQAAPGQTVEVQIAWRPQVPLERDYSWFVHLEGPQGIAGQNDITYVAGRIAAGETVVDSYRFSLRPETPPGEYRLLAGVYITFPDGSWERLRTPGGEDAIGLGQVRVRPRAEAPVSAHPLAIAWADGSRLVGVDYDDSVAGQRRVYLHWYRPAGGADLDLALGRGGQALAQARVAGGGEAGYQTVACDVSPAWPAGHAQLLMTSAGVINSPGAGTVTLVATAAGARLRSLGPWHRPGADFVVLPGGPPGSRYLDMGGEMVLVGARWQPPTPIPGAPLVAELEWLAARPLVQDYIISLSLEGDGWQAQHDDVPALGAIPTLKWLTGWRVRDVHPFTVPAEAAGPGRLGLAAYDVTTQISLSVGDDRLARAGQGVRAGLWEGTLR